MLCSYAVRMHKAEYFTLQSAEWAKLHARQASCLSLGDKGLRIESWTIQILKKFLKTIENFVNFDFFSRSFNQFKIIKFGSDLVIKMRFNYNLV